jgi:hypothetical protein
MSLDYRMKHLALILVNILLLMLWQVGPMLVHYCSQLLLSYTVWLNLSHLICAGYSCWGPDQGVDQAPLGSSKSWFRVIISVSGEIVVNRHCMDANILWPVCLLRASTPPHYSRC